MIVFDHPDDDPASVRAAAAQWRVAGEAIGRAGGRLGASSAAIAANWQGVAARSAVAVLERTAGRHDLAAVALDGGSLVLDRYADALDAARADIDRLNAAASVAEQSYRSDVRRAEAAPANEPVLRASRQREAAESHQAALDRLRREHAAVMDRLSTSAGYLGARLQEIAAQAYPRLPDPNRGPAEVVAQNASDRGEVAWIIGLALDHPNLSDEHRLWIMANRDEFDETLTILLGAAANPAVTEDVTRNYLATMALRNGRSYLANAFEDSRFEFMTALLLPRVVSIITSREFRIQQRTAQLTEAVVEAATGAMPPPQFAGALGQRRPQSATVWPTSAGTFAPPRALPRTSRGDPVPDVPDAPHTQLGKRSRGDHTYTQARVWDRDDRGRLVPMHDIDFTDHGRPSDHPNPHRHALVPNNPAMAPRGGFRRDAPEPL
jgi:hypothetical protein